MRSLVTGILVCLWSVGLVIVCGGPAAASPAGCDRLLGGYVIQPNSSPVQQALLIQQRALAAIPPVRGEVSQQGFPGEATPLLRRHDNLGSYVLASDTSYTWVDEQWQNNDRGSYTYSGTRRTSEVHQQWDTDSSKWLNSWELYYWYNGGDRQTSTRSRSWQAGAWVNTDSSTYTYDGNGRLSQTLARQWQGGNWVEYSRWTYTYDGNGNLTQWLMETKQGALWESLSRTTIVYDGQNREIESTTEMWVSGSPEPYSHTTSTYDVSGNPAVDVHFLWQIDDWSAMEADTFKYSGTQLTQEVRWQILANNLFRDDYTYDGNGNNVLVLGYANYFGGGWGPTSREVFVFQFVTSVGDDFLPFPKSFALAQNYPNPFNPATRIGFSLEKRSHVTIEVFNIIGQRIRTIEDADRPAGTYTVEWDGTNESGKAVASGIYYYRLKASDFTQTKKMILLK